MCIDGDLKPFGLFLHRISYLFCSTRVFCLNSIFNWILFEFLIRSNFEYLER